MTPAERRELRRLYRDSFDLVLDMRHYDCLCERARRLDQPVWLVLMAILERVFRDEIDEVDDLLDRPLAEVRVRLERVRQQPDQVPVLTRRRAEELALIAEAFPNECSESDRLFFTNLWQRLEMAEKPIRDKEDLESLVSKVKTTHKRTRRRK